MSDESPSGGKSEWGTGGPLAIPDAKMIGRAIRERWPISAAQRTTVINALVNTVEKTDDPRAVAGCAKVLADMDRLNVEADAPAKAAQGEVTVRIVYDHPSVPPSVTSNE